MQHQIYFCNIKMKQHETYDCNMCSSTCCPQWTLVDAELDANTELDATQRESGREVRRSAVLDAGDARRE